MIMGARDDTLSGCASDVVAKIASSKEEMP
jgi:hypothetical protein